MENLARQAQVKEQDQLEADTATRGHYLDQLFLDSSDLIQKIIQSHANGKVSELLFKGAIEDILRGAVFYMS